MIALQPAAAPKRNGADLIIHLLERQGVDLVAGIPGGALLPLYAALGRSTAIRHILARHEQAAGFIAQGMARITGKAGVCFATSGPGVTNVVTALADAKLDSIPLVCIAGQVPQALIGTDAFQEVPTVDMVKPITKATFFVRSARELWHVIPEAFRVAEGGRPGPVLIDVPKDVQLQLADDEPHSPTPKHTHASISMLDTSQHFELAAQMIHAAQRPVLYVGGGIVKARAHQAIRELAERAGMPVTTTLMALGALPAGHALDIGMLGMHGARYTNLIIDECDLLIAIGARFDDRATGDPKKFAPHARIVHIDIDPREFGKIKAADVSICADAGVATRELLKRVPATQRSLWLSRVNQLKHGHPLQTPGIHQVCSPYGIVQAVGALAPDDAIVTTDVGQHQMWVAQRFPFARPDRWLTSGGLGTMGFGLPAAIGAALAEPEATTLCFTGDGSLLMNVQELATLAELDLNVKIVLLDNAALGLVRQQQELFYQQRFVASLYSQPSCFVAIAQAFGIPSFDLGEESDPHAALSRALSAKGPVLIRVPIAATQHVLPMVAPGAANTEALDHARELAEESI
ncbi:biosynthetic-type acetolactate synthase large subunit [Steroidobacter sp.]|uniref:biosynthetic-type acetolactate synthase large subunit n=1 Tax=Steroidobacter sp. TaxID=1978227 RepID=UPI001A3F3E78|nr:biosynthetic-type acetolactate synthase large subunit [Steroidobacter sp.]MBL8265878.1 biosynthetic-type acetolactate synthase large subunit [Steroidobacter sp.]